MRVFAAGTLHNFVDVLVIALMALFPDGTARSLAITLLIVGCRASFGSRWIFNGLFGVFNEILYRVGFYTETDVPIAWLGQSSTALAATIVANIWRGFPFMMVLLLAGLQSINHEMYEAASVDGANAFRRFRDITLPSMKGISFVVILLAWIGSFMNFAIVQVMTAGGPANSSEVFATLIYKNAFLYADASYAATLGIILLALLMVPGGLYVRATMRSGRG
jgi:multiple sugar transport system permease protein